MSRRLLAPPFLLIACGLSCSGTGREGPPEATPPGSARPGVAEVAPVDEAKVVAGQDLYVPAYSHVATADGGRAFNLAITLFVRNVDPGRPITLTRVHYFDSAGRPVRSLLTSALKLGPLASMDFFVKESDVSGGASPSFLVNWVAEEVVADPVVETVMIGTAGTQGVSFTSPARVLNSRKP